MMNAHRVPTVGGQRAPRLALRWVASPHQAQRPRRGPGAAGNGTAAAPVAPAKPSPAQTARTIIDICREGTLCTLGADGAPLGTPVTFLLDQAGRPCVDIVPGSLEEQNLARDQRCSLQVQPTQYPARAVASVTLIGTLEPSAGGARLEVQRCLYFGGLDQGSAAVEVSSEELLAAEPDVLRKAAQDLIRIWNDERAEDIYRIVSEHLQVPLTEMEYAELLWIDQLGMYVRVEAEGFAQPSIVRVPFYRPVLDERDARSVLTMAAQVAWERDRPYTPPVPAIFTDTAAAANN